MQIKTYEPKPSTLPESLVQHLRFVRSINTDLLRQLARRRRGQCTWCGEPVEKGRVLYCSTACANMTVGHCDANFWSDYVFARDGGECVLCCITVVRERRYGMDKDADFAEFDHIVPVVEGGGFCGPENIRTLCRACHCLETRALRRRMAVK